MSPLIRISTLTLLGAAACGSPAPRQSAEPVTTPQRHVVAMEGFAFVPADLTVAEGDTVIWVNHDIVPHTSTDTLDKPGWDTGTIAAGDSAMVVIQGLGVHDYVCIFHPAMTGKVTVK